MDELLDEFLEVNRLYRFEGDSGLANLEKVLEAIGYKGHPYKYGSPIESFLSDNPGAIEGMMEWIREQNCDEWRENIENCLPEKSEEDN